VPNFASPVGAAKLESVRPPPNPPLNPPPNADPPNAPPNVDVPGEANDNAPLFPKGPEPAPASAPKPEGSVVVAEAKGDLARSCGDVGRGV